MNWTQLEPSVRSLAEALNIWMLILMNAFHAQHLQELAHSESLKLATQGTLLTLLETFATDVTLVKPMTPQPSNAPTAPLV